MSPPKAFTGQLPLMQVNHQEAQHHHRIPTDPNKFRLSFHTFVDSQYSTPRLQVAGANARPDSSVPSGRSAYKRIAFTAAHVPGQIETHDTPDNSSKPSRKRRRTTQGTTKTRLRSFKPLSSSSEIHADAWSIILAHTRPAFVMQMRTVSKFFYHITNTDTIWRQAREHHFGPDMPPRPSFLTERQYASLLDGKGCQNPRCERRETRKVRWVFRLRLCDECLSQKLEIYKSDATLSPQSLYSSIFSNIADREQFGTNIIDLLPTAGIWSGKPNSPRIVNQDTGKWLSRSTSTLPLFYLKHDYIALEHDYRKMQDENWEPERVLEWAREKYNDSIAIAKTAATLDSWEVFRFSTTIRQGTVRMQRRDYFIRKAHQLSPPMSQQVLSCFAAYHTSLASSNLPTERSWETLLAKILPYRSIAEDVVQYWHTRYLRYSQQNLNSPEAALFDRLHEHRRIKRKETGSWLPEQQFVLDLAEQEFNKLVDQIADEDLLLLCLYNVYKTYQQSPAKPQGLNFDGSIGVYRLSLDDARLIVEEIIEKRIKRPTLRGVKVLESLKCMGCTRFTTGKRYSFQSAFEHMLDKHSRLVGKDLHFHRFLEYFRVPPECLSKDYKFPWYLVEWTPSLPLLPTYAAITSETRWIPDEDGSYLPLSKPTTRSAFDRKKAVSPPDTKSGDFVANFVHAIKTLSQTRLDSECVVKIAIQYASDLSNDNVPSIEDFCACVKPTQELGIGLRFKFRCGACNHRPEVNSHLRCVKHSVEISVLRKHWNDKHAHERIDWSTDFLDLPSDSALLDIMMAQDEKLQQDQANSVERETIGLKKNAKKVPDKKAGALMHKEMAMQAFGRLFVDDDRNSTY